MRPRPKKIYDETDETKEESDVVAVLFFCPGNGQIVFRQFEYFFDDKYFLQYILQNLFF